MGDYGRRIVAESPFETVLGETCRALRAEGFEVIGRVDVRDHFWRQLSRNFRRYIVLQAWSPEFAIEVLDRDADAGTAAATVLAIYESDEEGTVVVAQGPFGAVVDDRGWRRDRPDLAAAAERETERLGRVLADLHDGLAHHPADTQPAECAPRA
jgi:uncharacterized protein (DUF302 family)